MIFHNPNNKPMQFTIGTMSYKLAPGEECDIPKPMTYVILQRGLLLKAGSVGGDHIEPERAVAKEIKLPGGVENIGVRMSDAKDEEYPEAEGEEVSAAVAAVAADLNKEGVELPGPKHKKAHRK